MYELWTSGVRAAEISRRAAEGLTSVEPLHIPRRSVHEVCTRLDRERGAGQPEIGATLGDSAAHAADVAGVLEAEVGRLHRKQASGAGR